jgi:hypothetical protein
MQKNDEDRSSNAKNFKTASIRILLSDNLFFFFLHSVNIKTEVNIVDLLPSDTTMFSFAWYALLRFFQNTTRVLQQARENT